MSAGSQERFPEREIPVNVPGIQPVPPGEARIKIEKKEEEQNLFQVPSAMFEGYFKDSFENDPGMLEQLMAQKFYLVPMKGDSKGIIRDSLGQIGGLPQLKMGEEWFTFYGPDGNLYATLSTPATSRAMTKYYP